LWNISTYAKIAVAPEFVKVVETSGC